MIGSDPIGSSPIGASGGEELGNNLLCPVPLLSCTGSPTIWHGDFNLTCPKPTLSSFGHDSAITQGAALQAPLATLVIYGGANASMVAPVANVVANGAGTSAVTAPAGTLSALGHNSYGENALIGAAPVPTLSSYLGGNAALSVPAPTLGSTATGTGWANAALTAPPATVSATGTVSAVATAALAPPMAQLIGYGGAVCSITLSGAPTLAASGKAGGVGNVAVTVPLAQLSAGGTAQNHGSAILTAPAGKMAGTLQAYLVAPKATLTFIGTAQVTATYEAYALNLNHTGVRQGETVTDEMTRYTEFPFTHVVRYKNSYYGVAAGGLYLLEGTTDAGADIGFTVQTAKTDFGSTAKKTVVSAYFGGRIGAEEIVSITAGDETPVTYAYTTPRGVLAQNHRQKFGRGIKDRYYAIGVSGSDEFELGTLDMEINQLTRGI